MDYNAIWNEICFYVNKNRNATEREYQTTVVFMFDKLGWSQFKGELVTEVIVGIGSASNLRPDIILRDNNKDVLVVELKRADENLTIRNAEQLISYMRFAKLTFGVLFGKTLQVYCDFPDDNNDPIKICDIPFTTDSEIGVECISLLGKDSFSIDSLQDFSIKCLSYPHKYIEKPKPKPSTSFFDKDDKPAKSEPANEYPCKGRKAYEILSNPDNESLYTGKLHRLFGKDLFIGITHIEEQLAKMSRADIDIKTVYLHHTPSVRGASSWMDGKRFVQIYNDKEY